jgi:hypothetical protein
VLTSIISTFQLRWRKHLGLEKSCLKFFRKYSMAQSFRIQVLLAVTIKNSVRWEATTLIFRFNSGGRGSKFLRNVGEFYCRSVYRLCKTVLRT